MSSRLSAIRCRPWHAGALVATCAALLLAGAEQAHGVPLHHLSPAGCVGLTSGAHGCGQSTAGLNGPQSVAVSPDGASAYAVSFNDSAVVRFNRGADGALTPAGCVGDTSGGHGCATSTDGLQSAAGVAVSPDGASVYAVGDVDSAIVRFDRAANGALTPAGCIGDMNGAHGCATSTDGLAGAAEVAVSPDGDSVYVASEIDDAVVRFNRGVSGALTPEGCVGDTGGTHGCVQETVGLDGAVFVTASPDGGSVYATSFIPDQAVVRLDRASNGALTPAGCVGDTGAPHGCAQSASALGGPTSVAVSPDGASAYVGSQLDDAVVRFDRASNGALTLAGCVGDSGGSHGCPTSTDGLNGAAGVTVSPDGVSVYAASANDDALVRFDRAPNGSLSAAGCVGDTGGPHGCGQSTAGLDQAFWPAVSPNGASVYVGAFIDDAVVHLDREIPPRCLGVWSSGASGAPHQVALDCFDPNGDPLEIAIVSGPDNGTLGAVNQVSDTVTYTPNAGFSGIDGFSFRSRADGKDSEVVRATVQVQAPPGPAGLAGPAGSPGPAGTAGEPAIRLLAILGRRSFSARRGKRLRIRFAATAPGDAAFEIRKGSRILATIRRTIPAGRGSVTWKRKGLKAGRYTLVFRLRGADGQVAADSARLRITKR